MSRKSKAPNDLQSVRNYVDHLVRLGVTHKILLGGSRSPLRTKQPHEHSDWDLVLLTDIDNLYLVSPRSDNRLHADLLILAIDKEYILNKHVEIWPNDLHEVLNG